MGNLTQWFGIFTKTFKILSQKIKHLARLTDVKKPKSIKVSINNTIVQELQSAISGLTKKVMSALNMIKKLATNANRRTIAWSILNNAMIIQHYVTVLTWQWSKNSWIRSKIALLSSLPNGLNPYNFLKNNNGANQSVVYYIYSYDTSIDYVGETSNFLARIKQEFRAMRHWGNGGKKASGLQKMAKLGGTAGYYRFIAVPVAQLGRLPHKTQAERLLAKSD